MLQWMKLAPVNHNGTHELEHGYRQKMLAVYIKAQHLCAYHSINARAASSCVKYVPDSCRVCMYV